MKTLIKTTLVAILLIVTSSCKKNESLKQDSYTTGSDSTETTIDSIGPSDTTNVSGAGTTGATGEGSTGSGSAGTVQKGTVKTDSTGTKKGR